MMMLKHFAYFLLYSLFTIHISATSFKDRIYELPIGWSLVSTSDDITNMQDLDLANIVWSYNENWRVYSSNQNTKISISKTDIDTIVSIKKGEGFWILMPNSTDFHFAETNDTTMPLVVINDFDKSYITYYFDINSTLESLKLTNPDKKTASFSFDPRGYPLEIITNDEIIIFSNYTDTTVGVSIMNKNGEVTVEYMTCELNDEMKAFLIEITQTTQERTLYATIQEKAQMTSQALDKSTKVFGFIKHVGETLEKSGKFTPKDAIKYASKKVIVDYLKNKIKEGSVTLEVIDNVHDMLSDTAGCITTGSIDCASLVYKTLKHTTDLYEIYEDIKMTKETSQQWIKESEALLKIKKAQYIQKKLLEELETTKHELRRDKDWFVECGDFSQKEINGICIPKTCKDDNYGCPSCNMIEELLYNEDGSGYCTLKPCEEDEKRDSSGFCIAKNCENDNYNCPICNEDEELFYYTDGSGYCESPIVCNENEKQVGNLCIVKTCEDDNYGCTSCKNDEVLVITDFNTSSGYCERPDFSGTGEISTTKGIIPSLSEPTISECPSGYEREETFGGDVIQCSGNGYFRVYSQGDFYSSGTIFYQKAYYTVVYDTLNENFKAYVTTNNRTYPNGQLESSIKNEPLQSSQDNVWRVGILENHKWSETGNRKESKIYVNKEDSGGYLDNILIKEELFYNSGKIRSRKYYEPYQKVDGDWDKVAYLEEEFYDLNTSFFKSKIVNNLGITNDGTFGIISSMKKLWDFDGSYVLPEEIVHNKYINGKSFIAYRLKYSYLYPRIHEYFYIFLQNDDGTTMSTYKQYNIYTLEKNLLSTTHYEHRQDGNGIWQKLISQEITYNEDGTNTIIDYEISQNNVGYLSSIPIQ